MGMNVQCMDDWHGYWDDADGAYGSGRYRNGGYY